MKNKPKAKDTKAVDPVSAPTKVWPVHPRPTWIGFRVTDPFDGFQLLYTMGTYDPELSAYGYYRAMREGVISSAIFIANSLHKRGFRPPLRTRIPKAKLLLE